MLFFKVKSWEWSLKILLINFFFQGKDCYLRNEQSDHRFLDLKLLGWNDSSLVEMVEKDICNTSDFIYEISKHDSQSENKEFTLRALASWDSSIHQSAYLNQLTPLDKHVYATIKINVKFKMISSAPGLSRKNDYIDLIFRKRVSVCVVLPYSGPKLMSLNRFKNLLNPAANSRKTATSSDALANKTSVIYRVISTVPKQLTEIENRESLAIKAASSINDDCGQDSSKLDFDNSASHFERYAKTIEAVDAILSRERVQQKLHLEKLINIAKRNELADEEADTILKPSQKVFSVPNLLKNVFFVVQFFGFKVFFTKNLDPYKCIDIFKTVVKNKYRF